ncbi:hypothetical protein CesoFtcFv8_024633 [Champsocephalus esox]|uniref:Uncharacterized protein n=2 Tax=Champsocephalus TaxID=52236 RepID=A0AAN8CCD2_CHAGU|nr:hypothetical protein CesoFtcFv8_024633 [Champsocephalus esox]KAK5901270.1 hypothetical protein CgunFtcFv8_026159 [Champsocephalus gunnari]
MILGLQTWSLKKELQRQVRRNPNLTFSELLQEAMELEREGWADEGDGLCHKVFTVLPADDLAQWKDQTRAERHNMVTELKQALKDEIVNTMQSSTGLGAPRPAHVGINRVSQFAYSMDRLGISVEIALSDREVSHL